MKGFMNTAAIPVLLITSLWFFVSGSPEGLPERLTSAAGTGNVEEVRAILDQGALIDQQDRDGKCALGHAAFNGHKAVVELLLEKGADVNARCK